MKQDNNLIEVIALKKYFPIKKGFLKKEVGSVKAVDDVSFKIKKGEIVGLVGESGCGKTTLGRCIMRAIESSEGNIFYTNEKKTKIDLATLNLKDLLPLRKEIQMIFQDPFSSLDPRMTVLEIISEPLVSNNLYKGQKLIDRVEELMKLVGLEIKHMKRFPHAFSGGQRQRIGIARALAPKPQFILADEPVSALDVSIQAQILNLLKTLKEKFNLTFLFISHDLNVVENISDKVIIMYVGKIVEMGYTDEVFKNPKHPYTEALLSAIPIPNPKIKSQKILLQGEVANPSNPPSGCPFHPRCKYAEDICKYEIPLKKEVSNQHFVSCHFSKDLELTKFFY